MPSPGDWMRYKAVDGELLLDNTTFKASVMQVGMGVMIRVDVDYENHNVLIEDR